MNKRQTPNIVILATLTAITVVSWVALEIYRSYKKEPPLVVPEEITAPLDPQLDTTILSTLNDRLEVNEAEIPVLTSTPEPEISPTPTASATASATPTATASATPL